MVIKYTILFSRYKLGNKERLLFITVYRNVNILWTDKLHQFTLSDKQIAFNINCIFFKMINLGNNNWSQIKNCT